MDLDSIAIMPFGQFEKKYLDAVADSVSREFRFPVRIAEGHLDISEYYNPARGQYNANDLLRDVDSRFSSSYLRTFGLFKVDLFIPILTYIFGQAFLNGRTGIASVYRLSNERYGIRPEESLILERLIKEVNHELGHTFGLVHCHTPDCVMRSSTYVEDIDQKNASLCHNCKNILGIGMFDYI